MFFTYDNTIVKLYVGYFVKMALFKYFKRAPQNFSAGIRICMSCVKLFHRGTFPVYGYYLLLRVIVKIHIGVKYFICIYTYLICYTSSLLHSTS